MDSASIVSTPIRDEPNLDSSHAAPRERAVNQPCTHPHSSIYPLLGNAYAVTHF